jgi:hypothetical protein
VTEGCVKGRQMDHRARLVVRSVKPHLENDRAKKHLAVFTLANVGPADAEITEIGTALIAEATSASINPEALRFARKSQPFQLANGRTIVCLSPSKFPELNLYWLNDKQSWFCVGYIKYRSSADTSEKTTGFCRKWDYEDLKWLHEPNEEFEF